MTTNRPLSLRALVFKFGPDYGLDLLWENRGNLAWIATTSTPHCDLYGVGHFFPFKTREQLTDDWIEIETALRDLMDTHRCDH